SATEIAFGSVAAATTAERTLTLTNDDEDATTFDALEIEGTGADLFVVESEDCTDAPVDPGESCTATVNVSPTARGPLSATLRAGNDSSVGDALVGLEASGIQGVLTVSATEIAFGSVAAATTAERTLTLTNDGDSELTLGAIAADAPFVTTGDCTNAVLEIDESCQLEVKFAPAHPGQFSYELFIPSDGAGAVRKVTLRGDSPAPPAAPTPPASRSGKPKVDASAVRIARNGSSVRVVLSVTARGGPIKGSAVKIRLPRVLRWRPMSARRDSRHRARSVVNVPIGDLRAGSTRAFAVRLFSSRDLRSWRTSVKAVATSAQGSDSLRVLVGG
ncbi:MAG: choice-of-anchor D domain-containing protein, partial [Solirubrobacterales bacterium]